MDLKQKQLEKKQREIREATDILARLLAVEKLTIIDGGCSTSSIDLENRVLNIVSFDDNSPLSCKEVRITSIAHEVGHAIFTPPSLLHNYVDKKYPNLFPYVNLVEDIRIESLIKGKYRGISLKMKEGRKIMYDNGFYGKEAQENPNKLGTFDKILLFTKVGETIGGLNLSQLDKDAVRFIRLNAVDEKSVIKCAKFLHDYCKEKDSLESFIKQQMQNMNAANASESVPGSENTDEGEESGEGSSEMSGDSESNEEDGEDGSDSETSKLISNMLSNIMKEANSKDDSEFDAPKKTLEQVLENNIASNASSTVTSFIKKGVVSKSVKPIISNLKI